MYLFLIVGEISSGDHADLFGGFIFNFLAERAIYSALYFSTLHHAFDKPYTSADLLQLLLLQKAVSGLKQRMNTT